MRRICILLIATFIITTTISGCSNDDTNNKPIYYGNWLSVSEDYVGFGFPVEFHNDGTAVVSWWYGAAPTYEMLDETHMKMIYTGYDADVFELTMIDDILHMNSENRNIKLIRPENIREEGSYKLIITHTVKNQDEVHALYGTDPVGYVVMLVRTLNKDGELSEETALPISLELGKMNSHYFSGSHIIMCLYDYQVYDNVIDENLVIELYRDDERVVFNELFKDFNYRNQSTGLSIIDIAD